MGKKAHPLAARIKRIMQKDEEVGKIAQATPMMMARAMELFLQKLCENSNKLAAARSAKAVTTSHLKAYVMSDKLMDFLQDTVAAAPDLPPEDADKPEPKLKRQRTSDNVGRKAPSKAAKTEPTAAARNVPGPKAEPAEEAMLRTSSSGGGAAAAAAACAPALGRTATATLSTAVPGASAAGASDSKQPHGGPAGGLVGLQAAHPLLGGLAGRSFGKPGGSKPLGKRPGEAEARSSSSGVAKKAAAGDGGVAAAGATAAAAAETEAFRGTGPFGQQAGQPLPGDEAAGDDADMQEPEAAVAGATTCMPVAGMLNLASYASYNRNEYDDDYDS